METTLESSNRVSKGKLVAPLNVGSTLALWLPCGTGNFFHALADTVFLRELSRSNGDFQIPAKEWWAASGTGPTTPSSSVIRRAIWAASSCGWQGTVTLKNTKGDDIPELLVLRVDDREERTFEMRLGSDGMHVLRSESDVDLRARLTDLLGEPEVQNTETALSSTTSAPANDGQGESEEIRVKRDDPGYLPFFQLNMLFGGLFNPAFIPAVFLESEGQGGERGESEANSRYLDLNALIDKLLIAELPFEIDEGKAFRAAFQRFLDVTFEQSLAPLKWRLERARRALLESMLATVVHRRQSLKQLKEELSSEESFDNSNEPQLRGYVMLVGGKLPVLQNVCGHVRATIENATFADADLRERGTAWAAMLEAIGENVTGLETAIQQAWMERSLYEQQQARAEQEAVAELQRSRVGEGESGPRADGLFAVLALIPAVAGLVAAGGGGGGNGGGSLPFSSILIGCALTVIALLYLGYRKLWRRWTQGIPERFYELNLRLDSHVEAEKAGQLLRLSNPQRGWLKRLLHRRQTFRHGSTADADGRPEDDDFSEKAGEKDSVWLSDLRRGALRIERISDDDALFKFHIDGIACIPGRWRPWRPTAFPVHFICELLHHRPSSTGVYIYRELRLICPAGRIVEAGILERLTMAVAKSLVDPFISGESLSEQILKGKESSTTIFKTRDVGPGATSSAGI